MRTIIRCLVMWLLLLALPSESQAQSGGNFMMTSVRNAEAHTARWNFGCPKEGDASALAVGIETLDIPEALIDRFGDLTTEYERRHGVQITSKTRVKDLKLEEDEVATEAIGPNDDLAKEICKIVRASYSGK